MNPYTPSAIVLLIMVAMLYLLPTLIALLRGSRRTGFVMLLNVLTGWTIGGWFYSLMLAVW